MGVFISGKFYGCVWISTHNVLDDVTLIPRSQVAIGITYFSLSGGIILFLMPNSANHCGWMIIVEADTIGWTAIPCHGIFWRFAIFHRQFCWDHEINSIHVLGNKISNSQGVTECYSRDKRQLYLTIRDQRYRLIDCPLAIRLVHLANDREKFFSARDLVTVGLFGVFEWCIYILYIHSRRLLVAFTREIIRNLHSPIHYGFHGPRGPTIVGNATPRHVGVTISIPRRWKQEYGMFFNGTPGSEQDWNEFSC